MDFSQEGGDADPDGNDDPTDNDEPTEINFSPLFIIPTLDVGGLVLLLLLLGAVGLRRMRRLQS